MQANSLRKADGLVDPEPGVLLLNHGWVVVAHKKKRLDVCNVVRLKIKVV